MDHRISKDMISSGMTPSGEKAQEDLGRTQYGSNPTPNAFADAYKSMYEKKEEVINEHHKKDADGNTIPHEGEEINEEPISLTLGALKAATAVAGKKALAGGAKMLAGKAGLKAVAKPTISNVAKAGGEALKRTSDPRLNMARQAVSSTGQPKGKTNKTMAISAGADLFDIVKGQLLDEGLSEEEIRDIMLTLTPDEIMSEMAVNPNIAAMDAKNKADMIARAQANKVPDKVREASKKQMKAGTPREDKNNPYTTQDKKTIIDYNKNK